MQIDGRLLVHGLRSTPIKIFIINLFYGGACNIYINGAIGRLLIYKRSLIITFRILQVTLWF